MNINCNQNRFKPFSDNSTLSVVNSTKTTTITSADLVKAGLVIDSTSTSSVSCLNNKENLLMHNSFNAGIGKLFALVTERNESEFQVNKKNFLSLYVAKANIKALKF